MFIKIIKILIVGFFLVGLFFIIKPIYFYSKGHLIQYLLNESWNEYNLNGIKKYDWFGHYPIGKLIIPHLDINNVVFNTSDDLALTYGLGRVDSGHLLHEKNQNIVIAGHRDSFFKKLEHISSNIHITLEHIEGNSEYLVENIMIVNPDEYDYVVNNNRNTLLLITCFPFNYIGSAPKRFIVKCILIK